MRTQFGTNYNCGGSGCSARKPTMPSFVDSVRLLSCGISYISTKGGPEVVATFTDAPRLHLRAQMTGQRRKRKQHARCAQESCRCDSSCPPCRNCGRCRRCGENVVLEDPRSQQGAPLEERAGTRQTLGATEARNIKKVSESALSAGCVNVCGQVYMILTCVL